MAAEALSDLLILSQVVLSMQLPFAIFPLLMFTSDRKRMGEFVNPLWARVVGGLVAAIILVADVFVLITQYDWRAVGIGAITLFAYFAWAFASRPKLVTA